MMKENNWPSLPARTHRRVTVGLETMLNAAQRLQIHFL